MIGQEGVDSVRKQVDSANSNKVARRLKSIRKSTSPTEDVQDPTLIARRPFPCGNDLVNGAYCGRIALARNRLAGKCAVYPHHRRGRQTKGGCQPFAFFDL